jgi:hypothetical protein
METSLVPVTEAGLRSWKEAAVAYQSQIPGLGEVFDTPEKVQESLHSYWAAQRGMRLLHLP